MPILRTAAGLAVAALAMLSMLAPIPARAATVSTEKCAKDIQVASDDLGANFRNSTTELTNVEITGCDARILARRASATSLDVDDSSWTLNGNVQITMQQPPGSLRSDQAVVVFRNNQIQSVTITGSPAEFEQERKDSTVMRGQARKMVYQLDAGTITLSDDAWLTDGGSTNVKAAQLTYDIRTQDVAAAGKRAGERVIVTIKPGAQKKDEKKDDKRPAPSGQAAPDNGASGTTAPGDSAPPRAQ